MTITLLTMACLMMANLALLLTLRQTLANQAKERQEMLNRLQARNLTEYEMVKQGPGRPIYKSTMQRANEEAERKGTTVASMQHPTQWARW